jgi:mycofactocin biosynthesis protein MftB
VGLGAAGLGAARAIRRSAVRLSFLKDRRLLSVVQGLPEAPTARHACLDAGIAPGELRAYERALARLAETDMLRERR